MITPDVLAQVVPSDSRPAATVAPTAEVRPNVAELRASIGEHVATVRKLSAAKQRAESRYGEAAKAARLYLDALLPQLHAATGEYWSDGAGHALIREGSTRQNVDHTALGLALYHVADLQADVARLAGQLSELVRPLLSSADDAARFEIISKLGFLAQDGDHLAKALSEARAAITESVSKSALVVK